MSEVQEILESLSLEEKIAQMFLHDFVGKEDLTPQLIEKAENGLLGGVIFFSGANVDNLEQLHELSRKIQEHGRQSRHKIPLFITLDQEGGQLSALHRGVTIFPGNMAMGFADRPELAAQAAGQIGRELKYAGININFAPVLDVSYDSRNGVPVADNRMFSPDPRVVSDMGAGFVSGIRDAGIMACAKHFPGQRLTERDTHHALDRIDYSMERLESVELAPFKRAISEGLDAIMTHHAIYESFDDKPATLSPAVHSYIRNTLGFTGLVISDDLIMKAIMNMYGKEEAAIQAVNAGVDLIIFTGAGEWFIPVIAGAVRDGRIPMERIDESARRILEKKFSFDIGRVAETKDFSTLEGDRISLELCREALVKYHDPHNLFPLAPDPQQRVSVVLANPARLVMSDTVNFYDISLKTEIESSGHHPYVKEVIMPWNPTDEEILSCFDIGFVSDVLIFTTVNAYRFDRQLEVLRQISEVAGNREPRRPLIISVATRSPDDAPLLAEYSDAVIVTGGITPHMITALTEAIFQTGYFSEKESKII
ncbi:glycoside hydrolase family 3 protein [Salinispira pacifica]|uniref:Beta-hexosaminidase n=1 Tax=Salinispira pacifica TaxID=1307761 RepID=V5WLA0_9SPIO|nr:glycoside hydrolase family 3 N-terminal domain-containing protein [Salinispira pacifica]AHC15981.1 Beta-hexosaminidase [Salinispira pacifica]